MPAEIGDRVVLFIIYFKIPLLADFVEFILFKIYDDIVVMVDIDNSRPYLALCHYRLQRQPLNKVFRVATYFFHRQTGCKITHSTGIQGFIMKRRRIQVIDQKHILRAYTVKNKRENTIVGGNKIVAFPLQDEVFAFFAINIVDGKNMDASSRKILINIADKKRSF